MLGRIGIHHVQAMTLEDIIEWNALVKRNTAVNGMPAKTATHNECPVCGTVFTFGDNYCPHCGQRVEFCDYSEEICYGGKSVNRSDSMADSANKADAEGDSDVIPFDKL